MIYDQQVCHLIFLLPDPIPIIGADAAELIECMLHPVLGGVIRRPAIGMYFFLSLHKPLMFYGSSMGLAQVQGEKEGRL